MFYKDYILFKTKIYNKFNLWDRNRRDLKSVKTQITNYIYMGCPSITWNNGTNEYFYVVKHNHYFIKRGFKIKMTNYNVTVSW